MNCDDPESVRLLRAAGIMLDSNEHGVFCADGFFQKETLAAIAGLPRLASISLCWRSALDPSLTCELGDDDLAIFQHRPETSVLGLHPSCRFTDDGLIHLRGLRKLWHLTLPACISDAGLRHLDTLVGLTNLHLTRGNIRCTGLKYLNQLPKLKHLQMWEGVISDAGMQAIAELPYLEDLTIPVAEFPEESLRHLERARNLSYLQIEATRITDRAVDYLKRIPSIHTICVVDTGMTPAGIDELRRLLPNARIIDGSEDADPPNGD